MSSEKYVTFTAPNLNRRQKLKQWIIDHQDAVAIGGMILVATGLGVVIVKAGIKAQHQYIADQERLVAALNDLVNEERAAGHFVYPLADPQA